MAGGKESLVLRLAGPIQSWGGTSQFNRRETNGEPTKSGIIGLLAAAQGRRRQDPIEDLLDLQLGVRTDEPGSVLRDYHTVSDYRGRPLLSAKISRKGAQELTNWRTKLTERFYLQDAVFVAAVHGPADLLKSLRHALLHPAFPPALGRRACVPAQPLVLSPPAGVAGDTGLWPGDCAAVLALVPWQFGVARRRQLRRQRTAPAQIDLPVTVDDPDGDDTRLDLPFSFDPLHRSFTSRRVRQGWVRLPTGIEGAVSSDVHDPFSLLGW